MELPDIMASGGAAYRVEVVTTDNRNAYARIRGSTITISLPRRMRRDDAEKVVLSLYTRMKRSIERHPERYAQSAGNGLSFSDGDSMTLLGRAFTVSVSESRRPARTASARVDGNVVRIALPPSLALAASVGLPVKITSHAIARVLGPALDEKVRAISSAHFGANLGRVRFSHAKMRWGTCTWRRGAPPDISIGFRLLFMPERFMDYVIVHELAHTVHHNHSKNFWSLVGSIVPNYKEIRKELRDKGDALMLPPAHGDADASCPA